MLVASKYEEIYAPAIDEFCYITDNTYTRDQVGPAEFCSTGARCSWGVSCGSVGIQHQRQPTRALLGGLQVVSMESEILRVLEFDLTQPTIKTFLRRFIKAASGECLTGIDPCLGLWARPPPPRPLWHCPVPLVPSLCQLALSPWLARDLCAPSPAGEIALDATYEFLCAYLAELTMMDYGMLHFLPSHIAASIVLVALYMLNKPTWSPTLQFYTNYMPRDLRRCAQVGRTAHPLLVQHCPTAIAAACSGCCAKAQCPLSNSLPAPAQQQLASTAPPARHSLLLWPC